MTFIEIIGLIKGIFTFFDSVKWLVGLLQKTPAEKHAELLKRIAEEAEKFKATGRPTWD